MDKQRAVVNIFHEQYVLKSDLNSDRVLKLAEQVDKRMIRIAGLQPSLSGLRVAVLVALELADEAQSHKEAYDELLALVREEQAG
jgi:cell division protein ZapA